MLLKTDAETVIDAFINHPEAVKCDYANYMKSVKDGTINNAGNHCASCGRCFANVPNRFKEFNINPTSKPHNIPMIDPHYKKIAEAMRSGFISDNVLIDAFNQKMLDRPLLFAQLGNNEGFLFRGDVKGTVEYNKRLSNKLITDAAALSLGMNGLYFLTITYDIHGLGFDIYEAWKRFRKHCNKICRALKRKFGFNYIMVLESTLRAYPHAHIILASPTWIENTHSEMKPLDEIKEGKLHKFIAKRVESPIFSLEIAGKDHVEYYLCKYISKSAHSYELNIKEGQTRLSKEQRKELLTLLMPFMAQVRQVARSKYKKPTKPEEEFSITQEERQTLEAALETGIWTQETSALLITLLYKLTLNCRSNAWIYPKNHSQTPLPSNNIYFDNIKSPYIINLARNLLPIGCHGCDITRFVWQHSELLDDDYIITNIARAKYVA